MLDYRPISKKSLPCTKQFDHRSIRLAIDRRDRLLTDRPEDPSSACFYVSEQHSRNNLRTHERPHDNLSRRFSGNQSRYCSGYQSGNGGNRSGHRSGRESGSCFGHRPRKRFENHTENPDPTRAQFINPSSYRRRQHIADQPRVPPLCLPPRCVRPLPSQGRRAMVRVRSNTKNAVFLSFIALNFSRQIETPKQQKLTLHPLPPELLFIPCVSACIYVSFTPHQSSCLHPKMQTGRKEGRKEGREKGWKQTIAPSLSHCTTPHTASPHRPAPLPTNKQNKKWAHTPTWPDPLSRVTAISS